MIHVASALPFGVMVQGISALYNTSKCINDFINEHIDEMKASENPTISRTGMVLDMAKYGFGIGYITPVAIIATGQIILGNSLSAVSTLATAATLTNPAAMTCAAFGAIYYGWGALTDQERNELIEKLSKGLDIGIELIKSIIRFVIDKTSELLTSKNFEEIKKYVGSAAAIFGKSLSDITHKITDIACDACDIFTKATGSVIDKTFDITSTAYETVKDNTVKVIKNSLEKIGKSKGEVINKKD